MSLSRARARSADEAQQTPEKDERRCPAYGCKCRATVNNAGTGWACFVHAFAPTDKWQDITRKMNESDWLLEFVGDLRRMDAKHESWREYAKRFWENSDVIGVPHPKENAQPYQYRMLQEFLWRIGQKVNRPQPRIPADVKPGGRFATDGKTKPTVDAVGL